MLSDVPLPFMTLIFIEIIAALIFPVILALAELDRWLSERRQKAVVRRTSVAPVRR